MLVVLAAEASLFLEAGGLRDALIQRQSANSHTLPLRGKDLLLMAMAAWDGGAVGCPPARLQPPCHQHQAEGHPGSEGSLPPPQLHLLHGMTHRNPPLPHLIYAFQLIFRSNLSSDVATLAASLKYLGLNFQRCQSP